MDVQTEKRGGQGRVLRVRDTDGHIGALKELFPEPVKIDERRRRMAREVLALARVAGPGVPKVLDHDMAAVGDLSVSLYYVQEWIDGSTLQELVDRGRLSLEAGIKMARELAEVVSRCHRAGVFHRDIKPDNILIDTNGATYLFPRA